MKAKNYAILCVAVSAIVALGVLFVPGVSDAVEAIVLGFLSSNAR